MDYGGDDGNKKAERNYKDFLEFNVELTKISEDGRLLFGTIDNVTFPEIEGSENKSYYLKLEKLYLNNCSFPVDLNQNEDEINTKFVILDYNLDGNGDFNDAYFKYVATNESEEKLLAEGKETLPSLFQLIKRINGLIKEYITGLDKSKYYKLYYPIFDIASGNLICTYKCINGTKAEFNYPSVLGFDNEIYMLLGNYFECDWGRLYTPANEEDPYTTKFYCIKPYLSELALYEGNNNKLPEKLSEPMTITASRNVEDFFFSEQILYVETTRIKNSKFANTENGYKSTEIRFINNKDTIDINKYILWCNNDSLDDTNKNYNVRFSFDFPPEFLKDSDFSPEISGKLIVTNSYNSNFIVGNAYDKDEYASGVTAQSDENDNNKVLHKIFDVLCQEQEILHMGPPSLKLNKIQL